jgi:outer membrane protein assembly factor BamB
MKKYLIPSVCFILIVSTSLFSAQGENWPQWRGPAGDGTSMETNLPVKWDSVTNVLWKIPVPGTGHSSPIIWGDRLFTFTALPESNEKILLCYDCTNGKLLWQKTVLKSPFEGKHNDNSFASGTPSTDGTLVFVSFLDGEDAVVEAYDFKGEKIWSRRPGKFSSPHGYSCSPVIYKDKVIINGNSKGDSFMAALSRSDGHTIWKVKHEKAAHSFSTPIFRELSGKMQMIFLGNREVASYNPEDGSKYWFINGPSEDFCSSPVYSEKAGLLLISSAWPQRHLLAIRPDGKGDVSGSNIAWRSTEGAFYVPSPVCTGDYLISTMTNGTVHCIEAATGKILWKNILGKQYPSPVTANGLVYIPNDAGVISVIKPGPAFECLATNNMGERMNASPAISNGRIYIRTSKKLYCIGLKDSPQGQSK